MHHDAWWSCGRVALVRPFWWCGQVISVYTHGRVTKNLSWTEMTPLFASAGLFFLGKPKFYSTFDSCVVLLLHDSPFHTTVKYQLSQIRMDLQLQLSEHYLAYVCYSSHCLRLQYNFPSLQGERLDLVSWKGAMPSKFEQSHFPTFASWFWVAGSISAVLTNTKAPCTCRLHKTKSYY